MRYEDTVRKVCGDDWKTVSPHEKDGGYGVAIVIAFLRNCRPAISDLATHLEVPPDEIVTAYTRLAKNGVFQKTWGARKDSWLLGQTGDDGTHNFAWSHIAALAGGFIGVVY